MANSGAPRARRTPMQALVYWTLVLGVWGLIFMVAFLAVFATGLPDTSTLYQVQRQPSISYLDRSGALVAVRGSQESPPVDIDQLPPYVPAAFIAIEDRQFYHHFGFNPWGMARAEFYNLTHRGETLQGGSTITQQLARNLFLTPTQSVRRKVQELILAVWLETRVLQEADPGALPQPGEFRRRRLRHRGRRAALFQQARRAADAGRGGAAGGHHEGAVALQPRRQLRARRQARHRGAERDGGDPRDHRRRSATRRSRRRCTSRRRWPASARSTSPTGSTARCARCSARSRPRIWWSRPRSTCRSRPPPSRRCATASPPTRTRACSRAALVALDGQGRIRAYVGGASYADSQFDRATQAQRQAGSSFKPFVYLTAMEAGHTPSASRWSTSRSPSATGRRRTTPASTSARSPWRRRSRSRSTPSPPGSPTRSGTNNVAATAHRLGITSQIQTDPSMALGAVEVTPLEMAEAYDAFANGGYRVHRLRHRAHPHRRRPGALRPRRRRRRRARR